MKKNQLDGPFDHKNMSIHQSVQCIRQLRVHNIKPGSTVQVETVTSSSNITVSFRLSNKNIYLGSFSFASIPAVALEAAKMSQRKPNYWDASDDSDTDAADAADLAEQPESVDEHKHIEIYFPSLGRIRPRKLNQLKTELRNKFNISTIEECQRTCIMTVSGYGFDREDVLQEVRRYDSRAS